MTGTAARLPKAKRPERSRSAQADREFPVRLRRYSLRRRKIKAERQGTASPVERRLNRAAAAAQLLPKRQPEPGVATSTQSRSPPRTAPTPPQRLEIAGQESRVAPPAQPDMNLRSPSAVGGSVLWGQGRAGRDVPELAPPMLARRRRLSPPGRPRRAARGGRRDRRQSCRRRRSG